MIRIPPEQAAEKAARIAAALPAMESLLTSCRLCGHACGVNRLEGKTGFCRTAPAAAGDARVSSHTLHFGEEPMLVGRGGSGTVFFSHCNLRCVFCQNHQISQGGMGARTTANELADIFLTLQGEGAENINLVTPTHYMYPILLGLRRAFQNGLALPVVYNTNGYDRLELLRLLDGIVDIYLPDMKYMDEAPARAYSQAPDYPAVAKAAILEMYRQAGPVELVDGIARKGLIIRHLILPGGIAGSYDLILWLRDMGLTDVTLGLMSQYSPQHRARDFPELATRIESQEYLEIVRYAIDQGFEHVLVQGFDSADLYLPDFEREKPFDNT
ncbi:MAG TPA: radical SAM protein [Candidatus Hydrogenedentes bacterium]|nr:radical SAM protein [Candidatus Hydrogenedentota bacterium]HPC17397.1 radical SAM protein [Candidatus Hydrogenedentota bacterium]HRT20824.1 radical SAM protein [Candidatus Hydrogenedentota bacterium]HRT66095.1 radical SAM protein [Candidatus Hydrogenedentota bacterium]